jgi:4'-phosphopantetheinyl transferase
MSQNWIPYKRHLIPSADTHIWRIRTDFQDTVMNELLSNLPADEQKRASKFIPIRSKRQYIVSRFVLREVLQHSTGVAKKEISFEINEFGKPFLPNGFPHFNISHSMDRALVALSWEAEIGIDIECMRQRDTTPKIARRFFSEAEVEDLFSLPREHQFKGFYNCWTRKEAYIKGKGKGLAIPLSSFAVSLIPGVPPILKYDINDSDAPKNWSFSELTVATDYAAAIAVHKSKHKIKLWDFKI